MGGDPSFRRISKLITSGYQNTHAAIHEKMAAHGKHGVCFMDSVKGDAKVEAIISLWKITNDGQLMKDKEASFEYNQKFRPSVDDRMKL